MQQQLRDREAEIEPYSQRLAIPAVEFGLDETVVRVAGGGHARDP